MGLSHGSVGVAQYIVGEWLVVVMYSRVHGACTRDRGIKVRLIVAFRSVVSTASTPHCCTQAGCRTCRESTNFGGLRDLKEVKVLNPEGSYLRIESIVLELALGHPWGRTSKASPGLQRPLIESVVAKERQVNLT